MLFWAGLRGAVGVALAAGLEGEFAATLKATILVVVVLTVIVFGGTIGQMLQILGIRTQVPLEEEISDDEFDVEEGGRLMPQSRLPSRANAINERERHEDRVALERATNNRNGVQLERIDSNSSTGSDLPPAATPSKTNGILGSFRESLLHLPDDRAQWFLEFDDRVLKPVLLDRHK